MMTTPEKNSETAETVSTEMTFEKLHSGFKELGLEDCDCTCLERVTEDYTSKFTRLMRIESEGKEITFSDFESHYEIRIDGARLPEIRPLQTCEDHCGWRGISINRLNGSNLERIKKRYCWLGETIPFLGKFFCTFNLSLGAGKVWNDKPKDKTGHHNLLKSDGFKIDQIIKLKIEQMPSE